MVLDNAKGDRLDRQRAVASWALERWAGFPVEANPRPWVFVGPVIRPEGGFRTGGAKISFMRADINTTVPIPDDVMAHIRQHRHQVRGSTQSRPLEIDRVSKSEADFRTDRGRVRLPAWGLERHDIIGRIWVLDSEVVAQRWKPPEPVQPPPLFTGGTFRSFGSTLEDDGQTLHYVFTGGAPEHVEFPDSVVMESDRAVAVIPIAHDIGPPGPRRAKGYRREVAVRLEAALGPRVLVNLDASPVEVVPL